MNPTTETERGAQSQEELIASVKWRAAMGSNDFDAEFHEFWRDLPASKRGDLEAISKAAIQRKPQIIAARGLADDLRAAKRNFLAAGGEETEWSGMEPTVRAEFLRRAALGERKPGALSAEDERKIRIAHASGLRAI